MLNFSRSSARYAEIMNGNNGNYQLGIESASDPPQLMVVWEHVLQHLYYGERILFLSIFCGITGFATLGNISTLYVVFTRKQRLLFKMCLLSLAMSDLIYVAASGANYISKLSHKNSVLWKLGKFGCSAIPFCQTVSLLVGSLSLVAIAMDRYLAVLNKSQAKILQSKTFCFTGFFLIWAFGCAVSTPTLFSYEIVDTYVVPDDNPDIFFMAFMCMTDMEDSSTYYIIVFTFIFVPILLAFIWLNAIIASEIWKRRHAPGTIRSSKSKHTSEEESSTMEVKETDDTNTSTNVRNHFSKISTGESKSSAVSPKQQIFTVPTTPSTQPNIEARKNNQRRQRQMRMVTVILVLMSVFIVCRMPNWIFLLYKLSYHISGRSNWLLLYIFGASGLLNCMLNPLLYTFLGETIRITSHIGSGCYKFCKLCQRTKKTNHYANNQTMFASTQPRKSDGGIYLGS